MAQTGYTPISLYYSTTAAAVPTNTNLANGELAINITDGKLYYKDNTGTVQLLASTSGSGGSFTNMTVSGNLTLSGGTANGVTYLNGSKVLTSGSALTFDGTTLGVTGPLNLAGTSTFPTSGLMLRSGDNQLKVVAGSAGIAFAAASGASTYATIDSAGNLGLGVTPKAWGSGFRAMEYGNWFNLVQDSSGGSNMNYNGYFNGTNNLYINNGYALQYKQYNGTHAWYNAPSGTAGNAISFTQAMTLDASGNLGVGTTSPSTRLHAKGSGGTIATFERDASGTIAYFNRNAGSGNAGAIIGADSVAGYFAGGNSTSNMVYLDSVNNLAQFYTNGSERLRIASNGAWGLAGANYGTAGQVLTSNGSGSAPTWQAGGGGGGSAATPTALGTVYGKYDTSYSQTFVGYGAGSASSTAAHNVAVGTSAMSAITTGTRNIVIGSYAAGALTTGEGNVVIGTFGVASGTNTFSNNTSGSSNIAIGGIALNANTTASYNIAIGGNSLASNTTGSPNLAIGYAALLLNTTGGSNVALGDNALRSNTTGSNDVAVGYQALYGANPAVSGYSGSNVAIGYRALYSAGTVAGNGTGDCTAVGYRAGYNTSQAGNGAVNTFIGANAGYYNVSGYGNTFIGASAGLGQTSGDQNICIGYSTGRQSSGAGGGKLIAIGNGAGQSNSGNDNTFVGVGAGQTNASASQNAYFGTYAGISATGGNNVALGFSAMYSATSAANNVAVGSEALRSMTSASGSHVAVGYQALYSATDNSNTAVGYRSGYGVTSGHNNVLLGINAGNSTVVLAGGAQNVVIGSGAYTNTAGAYNEIVIGQSCNGVGNDYVTIGKLNNRVYNHYDTNATWTQSSDVRLKTDIQDDSLGLSFINKLRPVKYRWKATNELELDNPHYNEVNNKNTTAVMHGLIAQEVKAALDEEGVSTFGGWDIEPNGIQGISREMFITPLINAVQELTAQVEALKAEVAALKGNV